MPCVLEHCPQTLLSLKCKDFLKISGTVLRWTIFNSANKGKKGRKEGKEREREKKKEREREREGEGRKEGGGRKKENKGREGVKKRRKKDYPLLLPFHFKKTI